MAKRFHIGDILSITTGVLVAPRLIKGVYDILNYITRDNLFTHQLPRARDECKPWLLRQHPQLASVDASDVTKDNRAQWLTKMTERFDPGYTDTYGMLDVEPIPQDDHERIDPYDEAVIMRGTDEGIVLVTTTAEDNNETA